MIHHGNLIQGTPEWDAYRRTHDNASNAAAMLGESTYKKRSDLMQEIYSGVSANPSDFQQGIYDSGHRFEALARPLGEEIIGEELYPVTGSEEGGGRLSASFDGLTMSERIAFEHKRLNAALREAMIEGATGADLPIYYQIQMEQQCAVGEKIERILFMASEWREREGEEPELIEARHVWYTPNLALRARIVAGWAQFHDDLAVYEPPATKALVVQRAAVVLPAIDIEVKGELAVRANFDVFKERFTAYLESIPKNPSTDQDFADSAAAVKELAKIEEKMGQVADGTLAKVAAVDEVVKTAQALREQARKVRLATEKLVEKRKTEIKGEIIAEGVKGFADHVKALNDRIGEALMPTTGLAPDFAEAIKGKRNFDSSRDAMNVALMNAKISASAIADKIQANLKLLAAQDAKHAHLFKMDRASIVLKANDDFASLVKARIAEFDAAEALRVKAEAERIEKAAKHTAAENVIRAFRSLPTNLVQQQASAARIASEINGLHTAPLTEELYGDRVGDVSAAVAGALVQLNRLHEEAVAPPTEPAPAPAPAEPRESVSFGLGMGRESAAEKPFSRAIVSFGMDIPPGTANRGPINEPSFSAAPAPTAASSAKVSLGTIADAVGVKLTADFIENALGVKSCGRDRAAVLFAASDWPRMQKALIERIAAITPADLEAAASEKRRA